MTCNILLEGDFWLIITFPIEFYKLGDKTAQERHYFIGKIINRR